MFAFWLSIPCLLALFSAVEAFKLGQSPRFSSLRRNAEDLRRPVSSTLSMSLVQADWESPRVSILTEIDDYPGSLHDILKYFWKHDINLTHIESRPSPKNSNGFHIFIDFHGFRGDPKTDSLMKDLQHRCKNMLVLDEREVPWFPRHISELDKIAIRVLDAGSELQSDHPGFNDPEYRKRRTYLAEMADRFKYGEEVPIIKYTPDEIKTWGIVYEKLKSLQNQYACPEYLKILPTLEKECGYSSTNIPQVHDISKFLLSKTGFQIRPVSGLLSSRDFLSGLAFRVFFSTQYIRHSSRPLYTPEPDICHELIGHAPMFADQDFADFSQEIGLASLGASDEDVKRLATCYWHTVEFGLVKSKENGKVKAYGAGLLSSFGELEYSCSKSIFPVPAGDANEPQPDKPRLLPWDPKVAAVTDYPITSYQPTYFVAKSLADAKKQMRDFCEQLPKPFYARYNTLTNSIWVDRAVKVDEINYQEKHKIKYTFN